MFFLFFLCLVLLSLSSVSAIDNNGTIIQNKDLSSLDSNSEKMKLLKDVDINQVNEDDSKENIAIDEPDANHLNNDCVGELAITESKNLNIGNDLRNYALDLNDLQDLIDNNSEGSTLDLNSDYAAVKNKLIIKISKSMAIDGHGHTIDLAGSSKNDHYFKVNKGSVTFKNIKFTNGYNNDGDDKGGAILFNSSGISTLINCTFENCFF